MATPTLFNNRTRPKLSQEKIGEEISTNSPKKESLKKQQINFEDVKLETSIPPNATTPFTPEVQPPKELPKDCTGKFGEICVEHNREKRLYCQAERIFFARCV